MHSAQRQMRKHSNKFHPAQLERASGPLSARFVDHSEMTLLRYLAARRKPSGSSAMARPEGLRTFQRTLGVWLLAAAPLAFAQESDLQVSELYRPFQGAWKVVAPDQDAGPDADIPEIFVDVVGKKFTLRGIAVAKDVHFPLEFRVASGDEVKPYRYLADRGIQGIEHLVDIENQIVVFWYVGIYEFKDDVLRLRLKYCGQGVEKEAFRHFMPPSSFDTEVEKDEAYVVLERVKG